METCPELEGRKESIDHDRAANGQRNSAKFFLPKASLESVSSEDPRLARSAPCQNKNKNKQTTKTNKQKQNPSYSSCDSAADQGGRIVAISIIFSGHNVGVKEPGNVTTFAKAHVSNFKECHITGIVHCSGP